MIRKSIALALALVFSALVAETVLAETLTVNRPRLNLRSGPGTDYGKKAGGPLTQGMTMQVIDKTSHEKWIKIKAEDGRQGWVFKKMAYQGNQAQLKAQPKPAEVAPAAAPRPSGKKDDFDNLLEDEDEDYDV